MRSRYVAVREPRAGRVKPAGFGTSAIMTIKVLAPLVGLAAPAVASATIRSALAAAALLSTAALSTTASASPAIQTLIGSVAPAGGGLSVELIFLNGSGSAAAYDPPGQIPAELTVDDRRIPVMLTLVPASTAAIPAGGFTRRRYALALPAVHAGNAVLSLGGAAPGTSGFAFALSNTSVAEQTQPAPAAETTPARSGSSGHSLLTANPNAPAADTNNVFLANLSGYQPIYAVYGPGTNTDARLQISFKYQLFGKPGDSGGRAWQDGIHFAFTERLYWDLGAKSSPFRNVDYMPELFYLVPERAVTSTLSLGGQAGVRHESNGRDGDASRSMNTVYIQPVATVPIGDYSLSVGPRLWAYIGDLSDNPDIKRYRGNTGLFASIGREGGLRVSANSRLNFGSGKGSVDVETSYPLNRLIGTSLNVYLFGQGFAGYGENLLDYNVRQTRVRFGIGIVR